MEEPAVTVSPAGRASGPGAGQRGIRSESARAAASGGSLAQARLRQPGQPGPAARPPLIRARNEQFLLGRIRDLGPCWRAAPPGLAAGSHPDR